MNTKLKLALKIVAVFLVIPFVLGRSTMFVLNRAYPPPVRPDEPRAAATPADNRPRSMKEIEERLKEMEKEGAILIEDLQSVRAKTRTTLIVVGIYYVAALAVWIILWRRKRSPIEPQQTE